MAHIRVWIVSRARSRLHLEHLHAPHVVRVRFPQLEDRKTAPYVLVVLISLFLWRIAIMYRHAAVMPAILSSMPLKCALPVKLGSTNQSMDRLRVLIALLVLLLK